MIDRRKLTPLVRRFADAMTLETGRPLTKLKREDWIEIARRVEVEALDTKLSLYDALLGPLPGPGMLARGTRHERSDGEKSDGKKSVKPTPFTKKRGRPPGSVRWTPDKARRYLKVFERQRAQLGGGERISDAKTARRMADHAWPHLRSENRQKIADKLVAHVKYFRRIAKGG